MWRRGNLHALLGMQNGAATLEDSLAVSYKTKHTLTKWSSNCTPCYLLKGKTYVQTKISTRIFIAALFIPAKAWKQPRCPSLGEQINKLWYILTMDYSALKRNEQSSHERTWGNLKCIFLSERSQSEKGYRLHDSNYTTFWKRRNYGDIKRAVAARGYREGGMNRQNTEAF